LPGLGTIHGGEEATPADQQQAIDHMSELKRVFSLPIELTITKAMTFPQLEFDDLWTSTLNTMGSWSFFYATVRYCGFITAVYC